MVKIKRSVGNNAYNHWIDVLEVQSLLNDNIMKLPDFYEYLDEDGKCGKLTIKAIVSFQKNVMKMKGPDGNVGPRGGTLRNLNLHAAKDEFNDLCTNNIIYSGILFPLSKQPTESYKTGMRRFGARRSKGKRKHAGCDLYAPAGTSIRAMSDGVVMRPMETFYMGTHQLQIRHEQFVARYGEISNVAPKVKNGASVKKGQVIAYVGTLNFKNGKTMSMLHLELYSGKLSGPLSARGNKYRRRGDLLNPTSILDMATL